MKRGKVPAAFPIFVLALLTFAACSDANSSDSTEYDASASGMGTLVYIAEGDLFSYALPHGPALRITQDGNSRAPRLSASGALIAFLKGESELWIADADGGDARVVGAARAFQWSPSEDRLAILIDGSGKDVLRVLNTDGTSRDIASSDGRIDSFRWSPDGRMIAFAFATENTLSQVNRVASVRVVVVDGGESDEIVTAGEPSAFGFRIAGWSPDSAQIFVWERPSFTADLADGARLYSVLASGGPLTSVPATTLTYDDFFVPAPTGAIVALVNGAGREVWTNKRLVLYDNSAQTSAEISDENVAVSSPSWDEQGRRLVYSAMPNQSQGAAPEIGVASLEQRRITILEVADGSRMQLTNDERYRDEFPLWSSNGADILFVRVDQSGSVSIWRTGLRGDDAQQIAMISGPSADSAGYFGHRDWRELFDWSSSAGAQAYAPAS